MRKIRIGNDLQVVWHLTNADGSHLPMRTPSFYLKPPYGEKIKIPIFGVFPDRPDDYLLTIGSAMQPCVGVYGLLVEFTIEKGGQTYNGVYDECNVFELVPCSDLACGEGIANPVVPVSGEYAVGLKGEDGKAGKDATINGHNVVTIEGDGVTMQGTTIVIDCYNKAQVDAIANGKQPKLTPGANITIDENNVISATVADAYTKAESDAKFADKVETEKAIKDIRVLSVGEDEKIMSYGTSLMDISDLYTLINVTCENNDRIEMMATILPSTDAEQGWMYEYLEGWRLCKVAGFPLTANSTWSNLCAYLDGNSAKIVTKTLTGDPLNMTTENKTNIVSGINEVNAKADDLALKVGDFSEPTHPNVAESIEALEQGGGGSDTELNENVSKALVDINRRMALPIEKIGNAQAESLDILALPTFCGYQLYIIGTGAPTMTPDFIGQIYIDTSAQKVYMACGVSNSGNFKVLN